MSAHSFLFIIENTTSLCLLVIRRTSLFHGIDRISKIFGSDSKSLWNVTLAPGKTVLTWYQQLGWTKAEAEVLRCAIMKYGIGSWKQITTQKLLPGKTVSQIVCQVQRMIGQQSLKGGVNL